MTMDNAKSTEVEPKPNSKMTPETIAIMERVLIAGDLMRLTPKERLDYYRLTCESLQLNPLTRPFEYIQLNGKLTLYARKECTEQLRRIHGISLKITSRELTDEIYVVTAQATMGTRVDESIGAVSLAGLKGVDKAHALMKSETKAKRRVTLSISGLGFVDESEIEDAKRVTVNPETGEIENGGEMADPYAIAEAPVVHPAIVAAVEEGVKKAETLTQSAVTIPQSTTGPVETPIERATRHVTPEKPGKIEDLLSPEHKKLADAILDRPPHPDSDVRDQVLANIERLKTKIGGSTKTAANVVNLFLRGFFGLAHNAKLQEQKHLQPKDYVNPLMALEKSLDAYRTAFLENPYDAGMNAGGRMDAFTAFAKKCEWTPPTIETARALMDAWGLENQDFVAFAEAAGIDFLTDMEAQALMELSPQSHAVPKTLIEIANKTGRNVITLIDELKERAKRRFSMPLGQVSSEQMDQLLRELVAPPQQAGAPEDQLPW